MRADGTTAIGNVREIWRYPVKSLRGEELAVCDVTTRGLVDDRRWAVYGPDGKIGSGKNTRRFRAMQRLLDVDASRSGDGLVLGFPDGSRIDGPGAAADAALSRWIGEPVALRAEDAVPHHDAEPIHLVSTAALTWLGRTLGDAAPADLRRFRANLLLDLDGASERPEEALVGRRIAIGTTVLRIVERTERCVMVGAVQRDLRPDPRVLRTLAKESQARLGVYAQVETAGTVHRGDGVLLLP